MKVKRTTLSTRLVDLYGRDEYHLHIELNREYWYYFAGENKISDKYGPDWYKLKVTYIRSGCMFYIFPDYPDIEENFCPIRCFMASVFELAEIDPIKDLKSMKITHLKKYRFDDTRTIVKNWDNSEYMEISDDDPLVLFYSLLDERVNNLKS